MISEGSISLPGEKYGFIGGTTAVLPGGKIVFLGDLETHPDAESIRRFIVSNGVDFMEMKGLPLFDSGSIMVLDA